jgi:spore germination protein GerM
LWKKAKNVIQDVIFKNAKVNNGPMGENSAQSGHTVSEVKDEKLRRKILRLCSVVQSSDFAIICCTIKMETAKEKFSQKKKEI